ncbi:alanine racemase [Lachnospiraceae bacterium 54-53]
MKIFDLETPALCVDVEKLQSNINLMNSLLSGSQARLRPHFKTNKTLEIAAMQMKSGAKGITCSKLGEAEVLAAAGIPDILIANQIVQPAKISRLAALAGRTRLTVCVDNPENIKALSKAATAANTTIYLYIEYEVGMKRCGVETKEEFLQLAGQIQESSGLVFQGIQAYAGQLSHETDYDYKVREVQKTTDSVRALKEYTESRGIPVKEVSGASTNTAALKASGAVYTEIQAGSYVFMDAAFKDCSLPFAQSLSIVSTVVSKGKGRIIIDCGAKSLGLDQCAPVFQGYETNTCSLSEEHFSIYGENLSADINDKVIIIPGHCCTTVNIFDHIYATSQEEVLEKWEIRGRGKSI